MTTRTIPTRPMTQRTPATYVAAPRFQASMLREAWLSMVNMMHVRSTRRLLAEMDQRLLADIGLGRGDALHEASRPFWDIDTHR